MILLAAEFGVTVDFLLGRTDDPFPLNNKEAVRDHPIVRAYDRADAPVKRTVDVALEPYMDEQPLQSESIVKKKTPPKPVLVLPRVIPLYVMEASAGRGAPVSDTRSHNLVMVSRDVPAEANLGIRIKGDSMEPLFRDGQIAWVKRSYWVDDGAVGVFNIKDELFIKEFNRDHLYSLNPKYESEYIFLNDMLPYDEELIKAIGQVVGVTGDDVILKGEEFGSQEEPMMYMSSKTGKGYVPIIDPDQRRRIREMTEATQRGEFTPKRIP